MTNCLNFFCAALALEIGVGRARLGTSDARPIGAYIFALKQFDRTVLTNGRSGYRPSYSRASCVAVIPQS
jgi:hypothetical protein